MFPNTVFTRSNPPPHLRRKKVWRQFLVKSETVNWSDGDMLAERNARRIHWPDHISQQVLAIFQIAAIERGKSPEDASSWAEAFRNATANDWVVRDLFQPEEYPALATQICRELS